MKELPGQTPLDASREGLRAACCACVTQRMSNAIRVLSAAPFLPPLAAATVTE